jgi:hypothetical protein
MEADFGYEVFEESTTADDDGPTCLYKREGGAEQVGPSGALLSAALRVGDLSADIHNTRYTTGP